TRAKGVSPIKSSKAAMRPTKAAEDATAIFLVQVAQYILPYFVDLHNSQGYETDKFSRPTELFPTPRKRRFLIDWTVSFAYNLVVETFLFTVFLT
ncbi:MAG TPA: hypothetical protein PL044_02885, partial [Clostridiales bacterium]|nr:hypothetical protein [Clostridiales bacterium]